MDKNLCLGCMKPTPSLYEKCPLCGYDPNNTVVDPALISPGSILHGRYIIGAAIRRSTLEIAYIAYDRKANERVTVSKSLMKNPLLSMCDSPLLNVTVNAVDSLKMYNSFPYAVKITDSFAENGCIYIVQEYIEGISLKEYISEKSALSPHQALKVLEFIVESLKYAYKSEKGHCCLSNETVYITENGISLYGYGWADIDLINELVIEAYPAFIAPEILDRSYYPGEYTDVYSLAALTYFMLTGKEPIGIFGDSPENPVLQNNMFSGISTAISKVLKAAFVYEPDRRTPYVDKFFHDYKAAAGKAPAPSLANTSAHKENVVKEAVAEVKAPVAAPVKVKEAEVSVKKSAEKTNDKAAEKNTGKSPDTARSKTADKASNVSEKAAAKNEHAAQKPVKPEKSKQPAAPEKSSSKADTVKNADAKSKNVSFVPTKNDVQPAAKTKGNASTTVSDKQKSHVEAKAPVTRTIISKPDAPSTRTTVNSLTLGAKKQKKHSVPKPVRIGVISLCSCVIVVLVLALLGVFSDNGIIGSNKVEMTTVPSVIGLPLKDAVDLAADSKLKLVVTSSIFGSEQTGTIASQHVNAEKYVKAGGMLCVSVIVKEQSALYGIMPDLTYTPISEAYNSLSQSGYSVVVQTAESDLCAPGLVIEQSLPADSEIADGTVITITVSSASAGIYEAAAVDNSEHLLNGYLVYTDNDVTVGVSKTVYGEVISDIMVLDDRNLPFAGWFTQKDAQGELISSATPINGVVVVYSFFGDISSYATPTLTPELVTPTPLTPASPTPVPSATSLQPIQSQNPTATPEIKPTNAQDTPDAKPTPTPDPTPDPTPTPHKTSEPTPKPTPTPTPTPENTSVTGVKLNKLNLTMHVGDSLRLKATVSPSHAKNKDLIWETTDARIISVSQSGLLKAKKAGTCYVIVQTVDGGYEAQCKVTVVD